MFEPFVEPWSLNAFIQQKIMKGLFDVKINSSHLLNVNVTYAMALCLQNISFEILAILKSIDTQMVKLDKCEHKSTELRKPTNLSASINYRQSDQSLHPSFMNSTFLSSKAPKRSVNQYLFRNKTCMDADIYHSQDEELLPANQDSP